MDKRTRGRAVAKWLAVASGFVAPLLCHAQMMIRDLPDGGVQTGDHSSLPYLSDQSNGRDSLTASANNARPDAPSADTRTVSPTGGTPRPDEDELIREYLRRGRAGRSAQDFLRLTL